MGFADFEDPSSVMWEVRRLVTDRSLDPGEDLRIAELQARRLLQLLNITRPPVSLRDIAARLRIVVTVDPAARVLVPTEPEWAAGGWHITVAQINIRRTRMAVAHQLKHIIDDQFGSRLYPPTELMTTAERRDQAAAQFACSLLMPRDWVEQAWRMGSHAAEALAQRFGAPEALVRSRLVALGLARPDEFSASLPKVG